MGRDRGNLANHDPWQGQRIATASGVGRLDFDHPCIPGYWFRTLDDFFAQEFPVLDRIVRTNPSDIDPTWSNLEPVAILADRDHGDEREDA